MKLSKIAGLTLVLFFTIASLAQSKSLKGVTLPDKAIIVGRSCQLVGIGVRKKFPFKIYVGGLYMERPSHKPKEVIADPSVKRVVMHFLYKEVSGEEMREAWTEGFKDNLGDDFTSMKKKIGQLGEE